MPNADNVSNLRAIYEDDMLMTASLESVTVTDMDTIHYDIGVSYILVLGYGDTAGTLEDLGFTFVNFQHSDTAGGTYTDIEDSQIIGEIDTSVETKYDVTQNTIQRSWGLIGNKRFVALTIKSNSSFASSALLMKLMSYKRANILPDIN